MSEAHDPLEAELAALAPHPPSPGLQQRIADRLAEAPPARARRLWGIALAAGLAAACLAAAILLGRGSGRTVPTERVVAHPPPAPPEQVEESLPTLQAYRRAFAESPDELDTLLDRHAAEPSPRPVPIHAFTRSDRELDAWIGEP
jgi:hypothetical protein